MNTFVPSEYRSKMNRRGAYENIRTALLVVGISTAMPFFAPITAQAAPVTFFATLGNFENPPTGSTGTGTATVILDVDANTLSFDVTFSGLGTNTIAAHIHCCVAPPGNAGVAVPSGRVARRFSLRRNVRNLFPTPSTRLSPPPICPAFIAAFGGGTVAGAEAVLLAGLKNGLTYFNIHTVDFRGGEIRGFLAPRSRSRRTPTLRHRSPRYSGPLAWRRKRKAVAA